MVCSTKEVLASDAGLEPAVDPDDINFAVVSEKGRPNAGDNSIRDDLENIKPFPIEGAPRSRNH